MSLYAVGDVHGGIDNARRAISPLTPSLTESDTLVMLGDVGIAYGDHVHDDLCRYLAKLPCTVIVMRGNHDTRYWRDFLLGDFARGHAETVDSFGSVFMHDNRYPSVLYVPDGGGIITIDGHTCLAIPGAWSIDGAYRREMGYPWEPEEQLTKNEMAALLDLAETHPVEYVFSHTCPFEWMPDLDDCLIPAEIMPVTDTCMEEWMDNVLEACDNTLEGWYFGHFHDDRDVARGLGHLLYRRVRKVL